MKQNNIVKLREKELSMLKNKHEIAEEELGRKYQAEMGDIYSKYEIICGKSGHVWKEVSIFAGEYLGYYDECVICQKSDVD